MKGIGHLIWTVSENLEITTKSSHSRKIGGSCVPGFGFHFHGFLQASLWRRVMQYVSRV